MRRRVWVLLASTSWNPSQVIPDRLARASKASLSVPVSGMACGRRPTTRMPRGASSADSTYQAGRFIDHELQMAVHGLLIESVDFGRLGGSAGEHDFLGDNLDRCHMATGEKQLSSLARKRTCDGAADGASSSVDHRNLVL